MSEWFITSLEIAGLITIVLILFLLAQFVWDRFWLNSFPILVELYARWRYPDQFKDD